MLNSANDSCDASLTVVNKWLCSKNFCEMESPVSLQVHESNYKKKKVLQDQENSIVQLSNASTTRSQKISETVLNILYTLRCLRSLAYLHSDHLNIDNIKNAKVCSCHFEPKAYNCSTNITQSGLLPCAVPTIVNCDNPSPQVYSAKRPPPKRRLDPEHPLAKRRRLELHVDEEDPFPGIVSREEELLAQVTSLESKLKDSRAEVKSLKKKIKRLRLKVERADSVKEPPSRWWLAGRNDSCTECKELCMSTEESSSHRLVEYNENCLIRVSAPVLFLCTM
ncbi:hypothetical protein CAPTEDRAFT_217737 [Capitella teleta]|uniref:THAP-type domain-containing protein n=1 Tax=Capitella teleta TaxID=283909 RepID=X2AML6_CAPTE|nr:hypothetical protein CAPTEDRAFT_217737 [Capitella teleta]|eukprot:ELU00348.1 hypothetical protein CAPTEDRAFT_217737 [Capitella teleta]